MTKIIWFSKSKAATEHIFIKYTEKNVYSGFINTMDKIQL